MRKSSIYLKLAASESDDFLANICPIVEKRAKFAKMSPQQKVETF